VVPRGITALRKIALPGFHAGGDHCAARTEVVDETLSLMLVSAKGVPHHRASAARLPLPAQRRAWSVPRDPRTAVRSSPHDGSVLFHGSSFRSIRRISGISPSGALGLVVGLRELSWPDERWQLDPAAVDGAAARDLVGGARDQRGHPTAAVDPRVRDQGAWPDRAPRSIDTRPEEIRVARPGIDGPVRRLVLRRRVSALDAECDIAIIDSAGQPLVELAGVQLVARPWTKEASPVIPPFAT
jgi:hypothetical protein